MQSLNFILIACLAAAAFAFPRMPSKLIVPGAVMCTNNKPLSSFDMPQCSEGCMVSVDSVQRDISVVAMGDFEARAAIVPDYGNCSETHSGYRSYVYWGDGNYSVDVYTDLWPDQAVHQYKHAGCYIITLSYCSVTNACESCLRFEYPVEIAGTKKVATSSPITSKSSSSSSIVTKSRNMKRKQPNSLPRVSFNSLDLADAANCEACRISLNDTERDLVIEGFTGYRGNVAIVPDYGTCAHNHTGYEAFVYWGDGHEALEHFDILTPFHREHQYPAIDRSYVVTLAYCATNKKLECVGCQVYYNTIWVSSDPDSQN